MAAPSTADHKFQKIKLDSLSKKDLSRKGSTDERAQTISGALNECRSYFTTSSCSGRIVLFSFSESHRQKKKGCVWLYVTHETADHSELIGAIRNRDKEGELVLKYEPFILHVQCQCLGDAQVLHATSVNSGFKNSGITVGKKGKIIVAIRSTLQMEVPISQGGNVLATDEFIQFLVEKANEKQRQNWCNIERLTQNTVEMIKKKT